MNAQFAAGLLGKRFGGLNRFRPGCDGWRWHAEGKSKMLPPLCWSLHDSTEGLLLFFGVNRVKIAFAELCAIKAEWGMSVAANMNRASNLGLISSKARLVNQNREVEQELVSIC